MGDRQNAVERVRQLARALAFPELRALRLEQGGVQDLLRLVHFALLDSSRVLAAYLVDKGYDLYGKTDARFVESVFRLLRDEFRYFPSMSAAQFLSTQFVERRLRLTADILELVGQKRRELQRERRRQEAVWTKPKEIKTSVTVDNHVLPPAVVDHAAILLERLGSMKGPSDPASGRRIRATRIRQRGSSSELRPNDSSRVVFEHVSSDERTVERISLHGQDASWLPSSSSEHDHSVEDEKSVLDPAPKRSQRNTDVERDSSFQSQPIRNQQTNTDIEQALASITQQIARLSDTVLSKISSVEDRLGALETRVAGLQTSVTELQDDRRAVPTSNQREHLPHAHNNSVSGEYSSTKQPRPSETPEKRRLPIDSPCTWPPSPALFERY